MSGGQKHLSLKKRNKKRFFFESNINLELVKREKVCNSLESFKHRVFILILIVRQFAKPGLYFFQSLQKNPPNLVFIFGYSLLKIRQTWFLFVFVFQGISHRYLPGDDLTDCSFIFLYILCTMSIRYMCIYIRNQLKRPALPPVL